MNKLLTLAIVVLASPASAQSPEGAAYHALYKCVEASASRYATALSDPLGDVAEAALASCRDDLAAFDKALDGSPQASVKGRLLADMKETLRQMAIETAAEARMKAKAS